MRSVSLIIATILIIVIIVAIVGVYYGYNMLNSKLNLTNTSNISISLNNTGNLINIQSSNNNSSNLNNLISGSQSTSRITYKYGQYIPIIIHNTQPIPTPSPFQQQIAICNDDLNIGPNFAYINDYILYFLINYNGSNVYFTTTVGGSPNIYSWFAGYFSKSTLEVIQNTYIEDLPLASCMVWWIRLDNGIPANSNVTIYMYVGDIDADYYSQYYPYVGVSPRVDPSRQYDNGKYVFIAYGYFNNTFDGWKAYNYSGSFSPIPTPYGIMMVNDSGQGTYILPPNNGNIPKIPLIVEAALYYYNLVPDVNVIALFGNTDKQINASSIGSMGSYYTPAPDLSTFVEFNMINNSIYLKSAMTKTILKQKNFYMFDLSALGNNYLYLIVNSTYVQAGYCRVFGSSNWVLLETLNTYSFMKCYYNVSSNLNYDPFQYGTLQISKGVDSSGNIVKQYVQWVIARAYPPNGVMPRIYIG